MKVKLRYVLLIVLAVTFGNVIAQDATDNNNRIEERLQEKLEDYKEIEKSGGWGMIPDGRSLTLGDTSHRVILLKERLSVTGDLPEDKVSEDDNFFDHDVSLALKKFQKRHNIPVNGWLDTLTQAYLNIPVSKKISVMENTLQAMEDFPEEPGEEYILINIPEFMLRVFEGNKKVMEQPVIVGDPRVNTTPEMSDEITYMVLNPYWNVPQDIAKTEILPFVETDSIHLEAQNYEIVDRFSPDAEVFLNTPGNREKILNGQLKLREKPSSKNPLGDIKFMFPNKEAVYLHGTPKKELFAYNKRAFSHGCIRLKQPHLLSSWLIRNMDDWDEKKLYKELEKDDPVKISLDKPVPIHIVYWRAYVEENGTVKFLDDIYDNT